MFEAIRSSLREGRAKKRVAKTKRQVVRDLKAAEDYRNIDVHIAQDKPLIVGSILLTAGALILTTSMFEASDDLVMNRPSRFVSRLVLSSVFILPSLYCLAKAGFEAAHLRRAALRAFTRGFSDIAEHREAAANYAYFRRKNTLALLGKYAETSEWGQRMIAKNAAADERLAKHGRRNLKAGRPMDRIVKGFEL